MKKRFYSEKPKDGVFISFKKTWETQKQKWKMGNNPGMPNPFSEKHHGHSGEITTSITVPNRGPPLPATVYHKNELLDMEKCRKMMKNVMGKAQLVQTA